MAGLERLRVSSPQQQCNTDISRQGMETHSMFPTTSFKGNPKSTETQRTGRHKARLVCITKSFAEIPSKNLLGTLLAMNESFAHE